MLAVEQAARSAPHMVREGGAPAFLELRTYRFRAHSMYDPELYRTKEEVAAWRERDPIPALSGTLRESGLLSEPDQDAIESEIAAEVEAAVAFAEAGTWAPVESLGRFVHSEALPA